MHGLGSIKGEGGNEVFRGVDVGRVRVVACWVRVDRMKVSFSIGGSLTYFTGGVADTGRAAGRPMEKPASTARFFATLTKTGRVWLVECVLETSKEARVLESGATTDGR